MSNEKREPLLSDDAIEDASMGSEVGYWVQCMDESAPDMPRTFEQGARVARAFYEAKITSGELIPRSALDGCVVLPNVKDNAIRTSYGDVWHKVNK